MFKKFLIPLVLVALFAATVIVAFAYDHNDGVITSIDRAKIAEPDRLPTVIVPYKQDALDVFSLECLSCHDGTMANEAHFAFGSGKPIGNSHPIGVVLPDTKAFLHPFPGSNVILIKGRVSCVTCHDIEAPGDHLAMNNANSALCFSCHQK